MKFLRRFNENKFDDNIVKYFPTEIETELSELIRDYYSHDYPLEKITQPVETWVDCDNIQYWMRLIPNDIPPDVVNGMVNRGTIPSPRCDLIFTTSKRNRIIMEELYKDLERFPLIVEQLGLYARVSYNDDIREQEPNLWINITLDTESK